MARMDGSGLGDGQEPLVGQPRVARRTMLRMALVGAGLLLIPQRGLPVAGAVGAVAGLGPPDPNGWMLQPGFVSRIVAVTGQRVADTQFFWHQNPDGGATFADPDGGWRYLSNSERADGKGGVGMLRFDRDGNVTDGAQLLAGSTMNCAGGATPWGTYLSCEEHPYGLVWEVHPADAFAPVARTAMGRFQHEAVTADADRRVFYLTEDRPDAPLYRFTPTAWGDLSSGVLEVLAGVAPALRWAVVPDPSAAQVFTHHQVRDAVRFNGAEGIWYADDEVYFTTKGDDRVWSLQLEPLALRVIYDRTTHPTPHLRGVDNLVMAPWGSLLIVEDGNDLQIISLTTSGQLEVFAQLTGVAGTELTGIAFDPSGTRLYVSSQRNPGVTYEITGPFPGAPPVAGPPTVTYTGTWSRWNHVSQLDGSAMVGRRIGSVARVDFSGSTLRWIGQVGRDRAIADVVIDGAPVASVDTYAATYASQRALFSVADLGPGAHVAEIVVTGANPAATGWPAIVVDRIETAYGNA